MKAETAIAKILKIEGTEFITGFPYSGVLEAGAVEGIRPILFRTERVAVNTVDGFTRASNGKRNGVCAVQFGPGIENAFSGVALAFTDNVPILILPGGYAKRQTTTRPQFSAVKNYREITKWVDSITFPDQVPQMMRRAFTYLRTGRPGPVMLELPRDVGHEEFDDSLFRYSPVKPVKCAGDPADIKEVAAALIKAKGPVIRAGQGVLYACAWDELKELAELLQIPVFTTQNGKSAFPENHSLSLGTGGRTRPKMVTHFLDKADLVFAIGSSCTVENYTTPIPAGKVIMQSTIDEYDLSKDYEIKQAIIGDAKLVLRQLIEEVKIQVGTTGNRENRVAREIKAVKDEWLKEWMPKLTSKEVPINPYRTIWDLMKTVNRKNTIITHEAGTGRDQLIPFWESIIPGGYIGWGKTTTLGSSLGFAMGAKLARPEKLVINIMGEGAFGMVGMDLEVAARENIPILTIVRNNAILGGEERMHPTAYKNYEFGVLSGKYAEVAQALGVHAEVVKQPEEITPAIQKAVKVVESGKPSFIEVYDRVDTDLSLYNK